MSRALFLGTVLLASSLKFSAAEGSHDESHDMDQREITLEITGPDSISPDMFQREVDPLESLAFLQRPAGEPCRGVASCRWTEGGVFQPADQSGVPEVSFPPGRPSAENMGNACLYRGRRATHPPHTLPQTGYSHLGRRAQAVNSVEAGLEHCCGTSDPLCCTRHAWMEALQQFCLEESSIKTRQYHCCLKQGEEKWGCFQKDAPNPSYNPTGPEVEGAQGGAKKSEGAPLLRFSWNPQFCNSESKAVLQPRGAHGSQLDLPKLSFPPGRPSPSNLRNACKLRKLRPWYPPKCLPSSGYGWFLRQSKAINRMEAELKKCCKGGTEVLKCADSKWREVMDSYCAQELSLKTTHHPCCAETGDPRYLCFAGDAPYPKYDREITNISLARLTPRAMQALCAPHRLLSRRFSVPLLVGRLREQCCGLEETERVRCAEREKEAMCQTDHTSPNDKHPFCTHSNKLHAVPIATAMATQAMKCPL